MGLGLRYRMRGMEKMAAGFTFNDFLKDLGMRISAASIVVGIFFGLGYFKRTDFLGLSSVLDSTTAYFTAAFALVALVAVVWILYQHTK